MNGKYNPIPPTFSTEIRELLESLLDRNPETRPDIDAVLKTPIINQKV
jgi:hypothetical protein